MTQLPTTIVLTNMTLAILRSLCLFEFIICILHERLVQEGIRFRASSMVDNAYCDLDHTA